MYRGRSILILFSFLISFASHLQGQSSRIILSFDKDWRFSLGDMDAARNQTFDDNSWKKIDLPHDWSIEQDFSPALASSTGYLPGGIAWYRKTFDLPDSCSGKNVQIRFDGIYCNSDVWINGNHLGRRPNGYISFYYDLTPFLKKGEKNTIAVRVDHTYYADSRWYTGSGIYRHVWLEMTNPLHIAPWGTFVSTPEVSDQEARIDVVNKIENPYPAASTVLLSWSIIDKQGKEVLSSSETVELEPGKNTLSRSMLVKNPLRWNPGSPYLYQLNTRITGNAAVIDETVTRFGIREFHFDKDKGFFMNGLNFKIKGVCIHHDGGSVGAAVPEKIWRLRLEKLKAAGCNAIRTSHNPVAPELLDLCDEMGLLVMDEAFDEWEYSKKKWIDGWNQTIAGYDGYSRYFNEWYERDLADMILRDRNHPSIILWSIGNEIDYANDPYADKTDKNFLPSRPDAARMVPLARNMVKIIKSIDTTRPVTMALANVPNSNQVGLPEVLDVVGYNYTESRYAEDHKTYPNRIIYGSENPQNYSGWMDVKNNDFISGQFLWTGIDYLGEGGKFPARSAYSGLLDLSNHEKPIYYWRQSMWTDQPMISLAARKKKNSDDLLADPMGKMAWFLKEVEEKQHWNYAEGDTVLVVAFSNCEQVELFLNGKSYGKKLKNPANSCFWWYLPYQQGELVAVAQNDRNHKYSSTLRTETEAVRIQLSADTTLMHADGKDVVLVEAVLKDKNNNTCHLAKNRIDFSVLGPGRIIGSDNGDARCLTNFGLPWKDAYDGRCLVIVQSAGEPGDILISAKSAGITGAEIKLKATAEKNIQNK